MKKIITLQARRPKSILAALAAIVIAGFSLSSCDFESTVFGEFNSPNDPRTPEYADYTIEVIAGIGSGAIPDNGPASQLRLSSVTDLEASGGFLYVADAQHNRVIRINEASGMAETIAGTGVPGYSGDGGPAKQAKLFAPTAVHVDDNGDLYILDAMNNAVRKVSSSGQISTYADLAALTGERSEPSVQTDWTWGCIDRVGDDLLVSHYYRLFRLSTSATGMTASAYPSIEFNDSGSPNSFAVSPDGTLWISFWNHERQKRILGSIANGSTDFTERFVFETGGSDSIDFDADGKVLVWRSDKVISKFDPADGSMTDITNEGQGSIFCINQTGKIYRYLGWSEAGQHTIVRYDAPLTTGVIVAGPLDVPSASTPGDFIQPDGLALDSAKGKIYFTESWKQRIQSVDASSKAISLVLDNIGYGVSKLAVGPDGELVFCAWGGQGVYRTNLDGSYSLISEITEQVNAVTFAPNGAIFAASSKRFGSAGYDYFTGSVSRVAGEHTIAKVGNGSPIAYTDPDGQYSSAITIGDVRAICFSPGGTLYLAEDQKRVLAIAPTGLVTRVTGGTWTTQGTYDVWFDSFSDADEFTDASESSIYGSVNGLAFGADNCLYISHGYNPVLRANAANQIEKLRFYIDGRTMDLCTTGIAVDSESNLYLATRYQIIKATPRLK